MSKMTSSEYLAFINKKPMRPKPDRSAGPEHIMQCEIVADFDEDYPELAGLLYAIPNGSKVAYKKLKSGKIFSPERGKLLAEGMRPGVVDLHLPVARGEWHSLYIECKILPNQPSDAQRNFMDRVTREGNYCQVVYTREQGKEVLRNYLNLAPRNDKADLTGNAIRDLASGEVA